LMWLATQMLVPSKTIASGPPTTRKVFVRVVPSCKSSPGVRTAGDCELPEAIVATSNRIRAMDICRVSQNLFLISILLECEASSRLSSLRLWSVHPQNRVHDPFCMSLPRAHRPPLSRLVPVSNHADMIRLVLIQLRILIREAQCAPQCVYLGRLAREKQPARFDSMHL